MNLLNKYDAIIVGAGFAGLYQLYSLKKKLNLSALIIEKGSDIGGTWFWNNYPGARCDSQSFVYSYFFSEQLYKSWNWSEKYPSQKEIKKYLEHFTNVFNLRKNIMFNSIVIEAKFNSKKNLWQTKTSNNDIYYSKFLITAAGCISASNIPDIKGLENFKGKYYHTGNWPKSNVDLKGKKVSLIGTGSSGIQIGPEIAKKARELNIFQRSASYSIPARNKKLTKKDNDNYKKNFIKLKKTVRSTPHGNFWNYPKLSTHNVSDHKRLLMYEQAWQNGGLEFRGVFNNLHTDINANKTVSAFIKNKIFDLVNNKENAKILSNFKDPFGTKRPTLNSGYYEMFNKKNISLIDLQSNPIIKIKDKNIITKNFSIECDVIVFATGFDAITGPLLNMNLIGLNNLKLNDFWKNGPISYLGLQIPFFPNLFTITGPGSPSVLTNMPVQIEQHVDWITNCIKYINTNNLKNIMPNTNSSLRWKKEIDTAMKKTLHSKAKSSWYLGANISGKPQKFMPYAGGMLKYKKFCEKEEELKYNGFNISL